MNFFLVFFFLSASARAFDRSFSFGVANAPGQVEDELQDTWLEWGKAGNIRSWNSVPNPDKRVRFWSHPEEEIALAKELGVESFRLGVDWGRVMTGPNTFDPVAVARYKEIFRLIHQSGMNIMLTLMHHSLPKWVQSEGGWHREETKEHFIKFAQKMMNEFHGDVDTWVTFNEANVFVINAYTTGLWPPGGKGSFFALASLGPFKGSSVEALDRMAQAHNEVYDWAHAKFPKIRVGVAHNMAHYRGSNVFYRLIARFADDVMNWRFPEAIRGKMDFFGFNYYGAEWLAPRGIEFNPDEEYSEAGRAIDVNGLYRLLKEISTKFPRLPIMVTENGIADAEDGIRGAYLIEHLLAVKTAMAEGVPVTAFYEWTLTDNLEWSDGYCPKFGLVGVNRQTFERIIRPSFFVFQEIIRTRTVSDKLRTKEWQKVLALQGKVRPFCRAEDGITAFDTPRSRKYSGKDWRFRAELKE